MQIHCYDGWVTIEDEEEVEDLVCSCGEPAEHIHQVGGTVQTILWALCQGCLEESNAQTADARATARYECEA